MVNKFSKTSGCCSVGNVTQTEVNTVFRSSVHVGLDQYITVFKFIKTTVATGHV